MIGKLFTELERAWQRSDQIFELIDPDTAWLARPIPLRHPFVFYLGHLPAFAWNQIARGVLGKASFAPALDSLFAFGIDPLGVDAVEDDGVSWPSVASIVAYRDQVRERIRQLGEELESLGSRDVLADRGRIVRIVIEHELMHHETLLYMVQQLPAQQKRRPAALPALQFGGSPVTGQVRVPSGRALLGARFEHELFGWDNEFEQHQVPVDSFVIDRGPVCNHQFREFVEAGGYRMRELWDDESWAWRQRQGLEHPVWWKRQEGHWAYRTMFEDVPLEKVLSWPVYVSWAEARAYARWKKARLPTEAEWHRAAYGTATGQVRAYPWGEELAGSQHGAFDFKGWAPAPVDRHPRGASAWGVVDLVGNGWEWTQTKFGPYPGFQPYARTYPGYSKNFFDNQHFVMLGASWATNAMLVRRSFRNWFQPHYPFAFAKFRCVAQS